ncbi:MAG TPA: tetratricopeptide repeat protein [Caulobacteraceae bacterium]|nr:tetratricopeptide repeat protein [Caulobacteraceae bacterium]
MSKARRADPAPPAAAEPLLEAALARREHGDVAGADAIFRQVLQTWPEEATALYLLGMSRFEAGAAAEAESLFERLTAVRPNHPEAHFTLASIRHWRDDRARAIAAYRRVLELSPDHAGALVGLARGLAESGDFEGARAAAEAAVAAAPETAATHMALAAARRGAGEVRNAADAFAAAARLAPDDATAHVGLSLALSDIGEATGAHASAQRAVALAPGLCDAWLALGTARRGLHDPRGATVAFARSLVLDPDRAVAHLNLGLALIELEKAPEAKAHLERVLELDPTSAKAHANLSSLYFLADRKDLAKSHALRALAIDPDLMSAHQNLAALLAEEDKPEEARDHRDRAYAHRNLLVSTAAQPVQRVLILSTTESGNTPDRYLIPPASFTRLLWFVEYASEHQMGDLPAYDVAFNAIGDEDLAGPTAANARRFGELCPTRLLNPPDRIARTRRDLSGELFAGIEGLVVPKTVRASAAEIAVLGVHEVARRAGLGEAFLVRPIGSHGGKGLQLVGAGAPETPLPPAGAYYLTDFNDFRGADGLYRKYRMIFVDGRPLPYHLAIGAKWMIHYESCQMDLHPHRLAEEVRFLADPAAALGATAMAAIAGVGRAMGLDYAGADFTLLPDGRALLFEANATMLAHPEADDGPFAHKNASTERIFGAFRAMLAAR